MYVRSVTHNLYFGSRYIKLLIGVFLLTLVILYNHSLQAVTVTPKTTDQAERRIQLDIKDGADRGKDAEIEERSAPDEVPAGQNERRVDERYLKLQEYNVLAHLNKGALIPVEDRVEQQAERDPKQGENLAENPGNAHTKETTRAGDEKDSHELKFQKEGGLLNEAEKDIEREEINEVEVVKEAQQDIVAVNEHDEDEEEEEEENPEELESKFLEGTDLRGYVKMANVSIDAFYGAFDMTPTELPSIVAGWKKVYDQTLDKLVDIFALPQKSYLPNYRNPCYYEGSKLRCLPRFMLIGVQKCGTTDLYDKMMIHPNISRARTKEPFWFNRGRFKGKSLDWYLQLYEHATEKIQSIINIVNGKEFHPAVTGEGSAGTLWDSHNWMSTPENRGSPDPHVLTGHAIRHLLPDTRFIVILREPTNRLYSDYNFFNNFKSAKFTASPQDFHSRVRYAITWLTDCLNTLSRRHCLFDPPSRDLSVIAPSYFIGTYWNPVARLRLGLYSEWLSEWNLIFPPEQTLVLRMEDYSKDRLAELNKIFVHVGLDALQPHYADELDTMGTKNVQKAVKPEPMLEETRSLLTHFYATYNERLATMLGDDKFLWKQ